MAKRLAIPSKEVALAIVGAKERFIATRIQNTSIDTDIPTTDIDELGNPQHAGTVKDIPTISLTFSAFDVGIKIISALSGEDSASFPGAGVDVSQLSEVDAIYYIKDATLTDYVKSLHAKRLNIESFTFSYSVDGEATEDYTASGSEKRWFKNDVMVEEFVAGTTTFGPLTDSPIVLRNGDYCLSVILDGQYLTEVADGLEATGEYSVDGSDNVNTFDTRTDTCVVVYHTVATGDNWADVSDATMPPAVRGKDIPIYIGVENILRVQSVDINGSMNSQEVREMGNRAIVGYQSQVPSVEGTLTVLDTDTELIDLLTYGSTNSGETEFQPGVVSSGGTLILEVRIMDPDDVSVSGVVLKTIQIPDLEIVGDSYSVTVNDNASQEFRWKSATAECIVFEGESA